MFSRVPLLVYFVVVVAVVSLCAHWSFDYVRLLIVILIFLLFLSLFSECSSSTVHCLLGQLGQTLLQAEGSVPCSKFACFFSFMASRSRISSLCWSLIYKRLPSLLHFIQISAQCSLRWVTVCIQRRIPWCPRRLKNDHNMQFLAMHMHPFDLQHQQIHAVWTSLYLLVLFSQVFFFEESHSIPCACFSLCRVLHSLGFNLVTRYGQAQHSQTKCTVTATCSVRGTQRTTGLLLKLTALCASNVSLMQGFQSQTILKRWQWRMTSYCEVLAALEPPLRKGLSTVTSDSWYSQRMKTGMFKNLLTNIIMRPRRLVWFHVENGRSVSPLFILMMQYLILKSNPPISEF